MVSSDCDELAVGDSSGRNKLRRRSEVGGALVERDDWLVTVLGVQEDLKREQFAGNGDEGDLRKKSFLPPLTSCL